MTLTPKLTPETLKEYLGNIDIYLFDQIMKGRFTPDMTILDAGCGSGRNLVYFLQQGYRVYGVDQSESAIRQVRELASAIAQRAVTEQFRQESLETLSFSDATFDAVICNAVLHFAQDDAHFEEMVGELWRVLKPGGFLLARLASQIGLEKIIDRSKDGRSLLPDGTSRYLVDASQLYRITEAMGASWLEPLKTVQVHELRSMTTWVIQKI
ncbi:class I SAM-dependent methyltransferase [Brevibacillus dissolubilis]|uniref:class I SAM-dependent methyltransferase n=1 Tax=Brevibacillus dissolubilis TaxID=1844116 RepID=UPI002100067B|nr:class I SAM-dependent methyltransferase [Brevibacillus dissolubilis]